jgi:hypothetical protein
MSKKRKQAPNGEVSQTTVDNRLFLEQKWDRDEPEYKHVWKRCESTSQEMKGLEPVLEGGEKITNGLQMLCRIPIETWMNRVNAASERSVERIRSIRNYDDTPFVEDQITKFASPKKSITEE